MIRGLVTIGRYPSAALHANPTRLRPFRHYLLPAVRSGMPGGAPVRRVDQQVEIGDDHLPISIFCTTASSSNCPTSCSAFVRSTPGRMPRSCTGGTQGDSVSPRRSPSRIAALTTSRNVSRLAPAPRTSRPRPRDTDTQRSQHLVRAPRRARRAAHRPGGLPPRASSHRTYAAVRARLSTPVVCRRQTDSGGRIRTCDLRVMSPTSYQTAPPRVVEVTLAQGHELVTGQPSPAEAAT